MVRIVADDDNNIHLTWHGTAITRLYANDQSYYSLRRAAAPGRWADGWEPPIRLQPIDPAQGIGFSYAPSLAVDSDVAVPVTFYDVGGQGFDAVARIVKQGALEGPPIQVADWMRKSIDAKTPEAALSARFPSAAPRLFHAPNGRIWLDLLETLIPEIVKGAPKLIVYHRIDVTDAIQGRWSANGILFHLQHAAAASWQGLANVADHVMGRRPYSHIFVIVEENHGYRQIIGNPNAPNINQLATDYGLATNFYAEVHPSEANYVAMIGGGTFGIHDDDAPYCKPGSTDPYCARAAHGDYADHTITARSLIDQLNDQGLSWKGYFENIPAPGSKAIYSSGSAASAQPDQLYAAKHNGFINFAVVQNDPRLASKFVGFDQLAADLASGDVPNYAHVVPNQCNEMHGLGEQAPNVPADCGYDNDQGLIARGDKELGDLVRQIQASPAWSARENFAIVITWDEDDGPHSTKRTGVVEGCCGFDPASTANNGGGHIATIVITNHGPRGVTDDTPYNHYSLLRTTEDAFGIVEHLNIAGDTERGVRSMKPLFGLP
ncbi:MAG: alkaline phosphatase family protein [Alphaproteobacteria bacterium]